MANPTHVLITSQTLTGNAASVTLGSGGTIPQTYTDLLLKISARSDVGRASGGFTAYVYLNGNTSSLTNTQLRGTGSSVFSYSGQTNSLFVDASDDTSNTFGNTEVYIPNYTSSNNKSFSVDGVEETNGSLVYSSINANLWSNTAAITSITITPLSGNLISGSTFYLYGIKNS